MKNYITSIKYGFIAGASMIVILLLVYAVNKAGLGGIVPRMAYMVLIFLMIWGGITVRRDLGEFKNFGQAFLTVFIISIIATTLVDTFTYILYKDIDSSIPGIIKKSRVDEIMEWSEKVGLNNQDRDDKIKEVKNEDFVPNKRNQAVRYATSFAVGAILSVLIGLFVNRSDERPVVKAVE